MEQKTESQSFVEMFKRLGEQLRVPDVDFGAIVEFHRKNLETLEKAANTSTAGAGAMLNKQRQVLEETLREINEIAERYRTPGTPQEMMSRQAEFARRSFEQAVRHASEMAELMKKSSDQTLEVLRERIREGMKEIEEGYRKR